MEECLRVLTVAIALRSAIMAFARMCAEPYRSIRLRPLLFTPPASARVFKSVDGGANWTPIFISLRRASINVVIDSNTPTTLYADTNLGILKSTDSGVNWTELNTGIPNFLSVNSITIDPDE